MTAFTTALSARCHLTRAVLDKVGQVKQQVAKLPLLFAVSIRTSTKMITFLAPSHKEWKIQQAEQAGLLEV